MFSPIRKPPTKTAALASSQTGQTAAPRGERLRQPIQTDRPSSQSSGGYASGTDLRMSPRLPKYQSEIEKERSTSRSRFRSEISRRQSISPSRKSPARSPEPDRVAVDHCVAAEGTLAAPGHRPRDLRPGPGAGDGCADVVDRSLGDLSRRARVDIDGPHPVGVRRAHDDRVRRVAVEPAFYLRIDKEDPRRLVARKPRRGGRHRRRERRGRHGQRRPGIRGGRRRSSCRHRRCGESERHATTTAPTKLQAPHPRAGAGISAGTTRACCRGS